MILNLAAIFDWEIEGIDFEQAFLESPLDKEIYMKLPKDVYCQSDKPNTQPLWTETSRRTVVQNSKGDPHQFDYICLIHDSCVFIKRNKDTGKVIIVVVYVDDILFIGNDRDEIQWILTHVESRVTAMSTMDEVTRYIRACSCSSKNKFGPWDTIKIKTTASLTLLNVSHCHSTVLSTN